MLNCEVYYGYYKGDCKQWDTLYVEIPDCHETEIEEKAKEAALKELIKTTDLDVAFVGLYSVDYDDEEDDGVFEDMDVQ
jgi:hypothetical protein